MGLDCCAKAFLVVVNIFFMLIGLVMAAGGGVLRFGTTLIQQFIDPLLGQISSITSAAGVADGVTVPSDVSSTLDIGAVFADVAIVLIVLGLFLLIMGIFGCCGACCSVKVMLIIYTVIVLVVFLVKLIIVAMFFSKSFDAQLTTQLKKVIDEKYIGLDSFTVENVAWNFAMIQFKCCGVEGYKDFDTATNWKKTRSYNYPTFTLSRDLKTPIACCLMDGTFPIVTPKVQECGFVPTDLTNNWNKGCLKAVWDEIDAQKAIAYGVVAGILGFELACAAFAICIIVTKDKEKAGIV